MRRVRQARDPRRGKACHQARAFLFFPAFSKAPTGRTGKQGEAAYVPNLPDLLADLRLSARRGKQPNPGHALGRKPRKDHGWKPKVLLPAQPAPRIRGRHSTNQKEVSAAMPSTGGTRRISFASEENPRCSAAQLIKTKPTALTSVKMAPWIASLT